MEKFWGENVRSTTTAIMVELSQPRVMWS